MEPSKDSNKFVEIATMNLNSKPQIDYNLCIICQSEGEELNTTNVRAKEAQKPTVGGYASLCSDLSKFIECKRNSVPGHIASLFESTNQLELLLTENKAVYHKLCRTKYNKQKLNRLQKSMQNEVESIDSVTKCENSQTKSLPELMKNGQQIQNYQEAYDLVFSQIVEQMENCRRSSKIKFHKLSHLAKVVSEEIGKVGFPIYVIHSTRLKDQLMLSIPGLRAEKIGREVILFFDEHVKYLVANAIENDLNDDQTIILTKASSIIKHTFNIDNPAVFSGSLNKNFCSENTVSKTLVSFISSLIGGEGSYSNIAENVAQIIQFNSVKNRKADSLYVRHNIEREQPLPLYLALMTHSLTGQRKLVDELFEMGLCVAYSRIMDIERALALKVCEIYNKDECVCPPTLKFGVFTTAAIDNIDHNPQSSTATYSFHGTGISLIQHHDEPSNDDSDQSIYLTKADFRNKSKPALPEKYYDIPASYDIDGELPVSTVNWDPSFSDGTPLEYVQHWLQSYCSFMSDESSNEILSWSTYNSRSCSDVSNYKSVSAMLPLIKDSVNSPAVVQHALDIVISATNKINPTQIPVAVGDEPVYAIMKQIQWKFPGKYGEDKLVIMLGGLHIEKSFLAVIGTWLEGSGWEEALVKSSIATPGRSEGILKSAHIKRARYAHEVSLMALNLLLFETFKNETDEDNSKYFKWIEKKRQESPQFQYWITTMELEAILLHFVKTLRTADFEEFISVMERMCPWYLVTDHGHYGRWLPVFLADMKKLREKHPEIYRQFKMGHFTSRRTNKKFSCIPDDQFHEQNNKMVKESSSFLGMLNDESSLIKWMVSGPEVVRLIWEYRNKTSKDQDLRHHEDSEWFQSKFQKDVKNLVTIFRNKGPFSTTELTTIGNERKLMNDTSVTNVVTASEYGLTKYQKYIWDRLITTKESIHQTIKQSQMNIFKIKSTKKVNTDRMKLDAANMDSNLFCKLFIACESRKGNVDEFFMHENTKYPPSISEFGNIRKQISKDDSLLKCLLKPDKNQQPIGLELNIQSADMEVHASALIVNALSLVKNHLPRTTMTVREYNDKIFEECIKAKCVKYSRIDVVFEVNQMSSLEEMVNDDNSGEIYVSVIDDETKLSRSKPWLTKFLKNTNNKTQFLKLLASNLKRTTAIEGSFVYSTEEHVVISNEKVTEFKFVLPIENTNARIMLHVENATENGHEEIVICTDDSSVVVAALYAFKYLLPNLKKLWVELLGDTSTIIAIHKLYQLHEDKTDVLPFFDAFSSSFHGIGKRTAWNTWQKFPAVTTAMLQLTQARKPDLCERGMKTLEKFTILMYDSDSKLTEIHECRRHLFTKVKKPRTIDKIPPTKDALQQYTKRCLLQAHIISHALRNNIAKLELVDWAWKMDEESQKYIPVWTTIPVVADHCKELITCKCKKQKCNDNCKCVTNNLPCTMLCDCEGKCTRKQYNSNSALKK